MAVLSVSLILNIHNAILFNPKLGFDASGHLGYISYILNNHRLPLPHEGWEFSQPPLYYLLASLTTVIGIFPQVINLIVFYLIALAIYNYSKSKIGLLAYLSLPMANIFPPLITNELLSGLFIVLCLITLLKLTESKKGNLIELIIKFIIFFTLGFYTKTTILILLPLLPLAVYLRFRKLNALFYKTSITSTLICLVLISPFIARNLALYGKPLVINDDFFVMNGQKESRDLTFFTNVNWILKMDTVDAHDYSFIGGLWNTYWLDGERIIAPIIELNKKALVLWGLGFPLSALSIYGLYLMSKKRRNEFIILISFIIISIISLGLYNLRLPYNSVLKAFFAFGLVLPYSLGIKESASHPKIKTIVLILLLLQLGVTFSYLYIQPWWHVARIN